MGKMEQGKGCIATLVRLSSFEPLDMTDLTPVQRLSLQSSRRNSEISVR